MMEMESGEMFGWDSKKVDAGLEELGITIGKDWSKAKKAHKLNKAIKKMIRWMSYVRNTRSRLAYHRSCAASYTSPIRETETRSAITLYHFRLIRPAAP